MAITASRAIEAISNELGAGLSQGLTPLDVVQAAYSHLLSMTTWSWLEAVGYLDTVSGSEFVSLPEDFGNISRYMSQDIYLKVLPDDQYQQLVQCQTYMLGSTYIARLDREADRLEFPAPFTESVSKQFWVAYQRAEIEVKDASTTLPLPRYMHPLYLSMARSFARGWEESDESDLQVLLERIRNGPVFAAAIQADIRAKVASIRPQYQNTRVSKFSSDAVRFGAYGSVIAVDGTIIPPTRL